MYEARQNKEKVSRRIDAADGRARQRNYMNKKMRHYKNICDSTLQCRSITLFNLLPFLTNNKTRDYTIVGGNFQPEIYTVTREGNNISKVLAPLVAQVGNAVSVVLKNNRSWREGKVDNDNLLNEFHVVYKMPQRGICEEVVYNSSQNSYGLAAEIKGDDKVSYKSYAQNIDKSHFGINLNNRDSTYSETHYIIKEQTISNTISNVKKTKGKAGDALSIAVVEAARFAFLRNHIGEMKTNTLLRFNNKCVTLSVLFSNYKNILEKYYHSNLSKPGWEQYDLTADMILGIIGSLEFFRNFNANEGTKYFDAVNQKFHSRFQ